MQRHYTFVQRRAATAARLIDASTITTPCPVIYRSGSLVGVAAPLKKTESFLQLYCLQDAS